MSQLQTELRLAISGGLATMPLIAAACGWASHWNAYTNLSLTLGGIVLWSTLVVRLKERAGERPQP